MPNDGTNLLEVPGNRLPETGSRQMEILHIRGAWFYVGSDQPGRIKSQQYCEVQGGRNTVKVKDLKPKRIKDYLECKISQRTSKVNTVHVRDQKHELTPPRDRKSDKAGPVVSSRDIPFVIQPKQIIEAPR
ncbi:hypothetical protein GQ457_03G020850 [Hibiscus cannabinus]